MTSAFRTAPPPNIPRTCRLGGFLGRFWSVWLVLIACVSGGAPERAMAQASAEEGVDPYARMFEVVSARGPLQGPPLLHRMESVVRSVNARQKHAEIAVKRGIRSPDHPPFHPPPGLVEFLQTMNEPLDLLAEATVSSDAWRIDWERMGREGEEGMPTDFRRFVQLTLDFHETFPEVRGRDRLAGDLEGLLVMARRFGEAGLAHHYRQALGSERAVMEWLAANASRLPPEVTRELLAMRDRLPPRDNIEGILAREEAMTRGQLWRTFSGLGDGDWSEGVETGAGTLRISSIVRIGREVVIGFETDDGKSFTLETGQQRHGFELVMVDLDEGKALVRSGGEMLAVYLEPREVGKVDLERAWLRVARYLDDAGLMFDLPSAGWFGRRPPEDRFQELLATVKRDYEKLRMTLRETAATDTSVFGPGADFVQSSLPLLVNTRQSEVRQRVNDNLVFSGIQHLIDPEAPLTCSITGRPITVEQSDREMVLLSPLQHRGEPIRLTMPLAP